ERIMDVLSRPRRVKLKGAGRSVEARILIRAGPGAVKEGTIHDAACAPAPPLRHLAVLREDPQGARAQATRLGCRRAAQHHAEAGADSVDGRVSPHPG